MFFGSSSGVSRGSCGVDLVCLPLGAKTKIVESLGARCNLQGTDFRCTFRIIIYFSFNPREMSSICSPEAAPRMLALRVTLILPDYNPVTHQNVFQGRFMSGGQMDKAQSKNVLTQKRDKQCIRK
jgi:hypothetical protein